MAESGKTTSDQPAVTGNVFFHLTEKKYGEIGGWFSYVLMHLKREMTTAGDDGHSVLYPLYPEMRPSQRVFRIPHFRQRHVISKPKSPGIFRAFPHRR